MIFRLHRYRIVHVPRKHNFLDNYYFTYWTKRAAEHYCKNCNNAAEALGLTDRYEVEKIR